MKVRELIEKLKEFDPELPAVVFDHRVGDFFEISTDRAAIPKNGTYEDEQGNEAKGPYLVIDGW